MKLQKIVLLLCACVVGFWNSSGCVFASSSLFWATDEKIQRSVLDGVFAEDLISGVSPNDIFVDPKNGHVYWTEGIPMAPSIFGTYSGSINRMNIDGSYPERLVGNLQGGPESITVNVDGDRIYWCRDENLYGDSGWSSLDGSDATIFAPYEHPYADIVFDPKRQVLYAATTQAYINVFDLDWNFLYKIVDTDYNLPHELIVPTAIAIDTVRDHIYWSDLVHKSIFRADLGDQINVNVIEIFPDLGYVPSALAIDAEEGHIYWGSHGEEWWSIHRAKLDGDDEEVIRSDRGKIRGLQVVKNSVDPLDTVLESLDEKFSEIDARLRKLERKSRRLERKDRRFMRLLVRFLNERSREN